MVSHLRDMQPKIVREHTAQIFAMRKEKSFIKPINRRLAEACAIMVANWMGEVVLNIKDEYSRCLTPQLDVIEPKVRRIQQVDTDEYEDVLKVLGDSKEKQ